MNTLLKDGVELATSINNFFKEEQLKPDVNIILGVPFTHIEACVKTVDTSKIHISAQNCSQFDMGAYTGEISCSMLKGIGTQYVIVGHSERRQLFGDTNTIISTKIVRVHENSMIPILCCGETLNQRNNNEHFDIIKKQLEKSLELTDSSNILKTVIAYEPVWAIGTGKTASPEQAQEMHMFIRNTIAELYNKDIAEQITILYGGSVKPANAVELFAQKDIDGGLIGGASLNANDFIQIYKSI